MKLYHRKLDTTSGNILFPLNTLQGEYPDAYQCALEKYRGREHIINQLIPGTDLLWNDALHSSPIHPHKALTARRNAGLPKITRTYYVIETENLDQSKLLIYTYPFPPKRNLNATDFIPFSEEYFKDKQQVPLETQEYYKKCHNEGRNPLLWHLIPHVLYFGNIDVSKVETITLG